MGSVFRDVLNRSVVVLESNDALNVTLSIGIDHSALTFVGMVLREVLSIAFGVEKRLDAIFGDFSGRRARMDGLSFGRRGRDLLCFFGRLEGSYRLLRGARIVDLIIVDDIALTDLTCVQTRQIVFGFDSLG